MSMVPVRCRTCVRWTKDEIEFLKKNYSTTIWDKLLYNLHKTRTKKSTQIKAMRLGLKKERKYTVNEKFFDTWTSQMTYLLGYIAADGCLRIKDRGSYMLRFLSKDWRLLIKIRKALDSVHLLNIKKVDNKIYYLLEIGSKKMIKRLLSLGILPCTNSAKTKYQIFPYVPQSYISDFIRGSFDGDGSVYLTKHIYRNVPTTITLDLVLEGTFCFLDKMSQLFNLYLQINLKTPSFINGTYKIQYHNNETVRILDWLYKDADIYLERKFKIYRENRHKGIKLKYAKNKYIPLEEVLSRVN